MISEKAPLTADTSGGDERRLLVAVLLNPPMNGGRRTNERLKVVRDYLECDAVRIVNLYPGATKDLAGLAEVACDPSVWLKHRSVIAEELRQCNEVLLGWGVSLPAGAARIQMIAQVGWVADELRMIGIVPWIVGDGPRHPSRWHQYVSDRYGRTSGGSFVERVRECLVQCNFRPR